MDLISFFFTLICLICTLVLIIVLYSLFKANDLFYAKLRDYQKISKKMFQQEAVKQKRSVKSAVKPKTKPDKEPKFEDAEYREVK